MVRTSPVSSRWRTLVAAGLLALPAMLAPARAGAEVDLELWPLVQTVAPGAEFEIVLQVTNVSPPFNAFHAVLAFDPAALTPVQMSPKSLQLGPLMTSRCGNITNWFHMGTSSDTIDVFMLCADSSTTGPGTIYRVHFRASTTPQVTSVRVLPDLQFVNNGIVLADAVSRNAAVGIGMTPTLGIPAAAEARWALRARPNPAHGGVAFDFGRPLAVAGVLAVHDVQGRLLRRLALAPGAGGGAWDGRDAQGRRVPPGQYTVSLRSGEVLRTIHVAQVR